MMDLPELVGGSDDLPGVDPIAWEKCKKDWDNWRSQEMNTFMYQVRAGMEGKNIGLGNGLTTINKYIHGTHARRYYLVCADSGVGKTTVGDSMYVLNAWFDAKAKGKRIKIFYFSFEIPKLEKEARWVVWLVHRLYNVSLSTDYIMGRLEGRQLSEKHYQYVQAAYIKLKEIEQDVEIIETPIGPAGLFTILLKYYTSVGTVLYTDITQEEKDAGKHPLIRGYIANDPELLVMSVTDHLGLINLAPGSDTKQSMDLYSRYLVFFRNMFWHTPVVYQQFSTDIMSYHRSKKQPTEGMLTPSRLDLGDTKATFRDADHVFGLVQPVKFDFDKFMNYTIFTKDSDEGLGEYFVAMFNMKNRYGPSGRIIPIFQDGLTGTEYDLPHPNPFSLQTWYAKAKQIDKLCLEYSPRSG